MLSELKSHLKGVTSADIRTRQLPLSISISYLISSAGLVKMTEEQAHASCQLGIAEVEALAVGTFEEVS